MIIKHIAGTSQTHIGSNAFGAKVSVTSLTGKQYGIVLTNQRDFGTSRYDDNSIKTPLVSARSLSLIIEIPPAKAKTMKNNIGVLLLCKPLLYELEEEMTPAMATKKKLMEEMTPSTKKLMEEMNSSIKNVGGLLK